MRIPPALVLFAFFSLLCSCSGGDTGEVVRPDVPGKGVMAKRTLLVYMMAENSLSSYASSDLLEITKAAVSVPSDCRLFVYVDDVSHPYLTQFFCNSEGEGSCMTYIPFENDVCSSDITVFSDLLDYILDDYPTEVLDLVMWSHGNGWLRAPLKSSPQRSIGIDNGKNTYSNSITRTIEIEELAEVLKKLPARVDRILFDACFMQCAEVAYALRGVADWIIASPAEIPADGAPYETVAPAFFSTDGPDVIMDSYLRAYEHSSSGVVISAIKPAAMIALADATSYYVNKYFPRDKKREYIDAFAYLPGGAERYTCYYDANAVMSKYLTDEEFALWRNELDKAVVYTVSSGAWYSGVIGRFLSYDVSSGCGMSMYMPQEGDLNIDFNRDFATTEWYYAAGWKLAGW